MIDLICYFIIALIPIFLIRNFNTYNKRCVIINAIYEYQIWKHNCGEAIEIGYEDMEKYYDTFFRLNDWGYKNILPENKYEIIKKYL